MKNNYVGLFFNSVGAIVMPYVVVTLLNDFLPRRRLCETLNGRANVKEALL